MMKRSRNSRQRGYPLLELMVTMAIVATLTSVAYPVYTGIMIQARMMRAVAHQDQVVKAMKMYALDHDGSYPYFDTSGQSDGPPQKFSTMRYVR